jgi:hypothetical protein
LISDHIFLRISTSAAAQTPASTRACDSFAVSFAWYSCRDRRLLHNIGVDGRVSDSLFRSTGLHNLTRNFLLSAEDGRRCSMLTINDRKLTALNWQHYYGSKLRPFEILSNLIDGYRAASTDFTLVSYVHDELFGLNPF